MGGIIAKLTCMGGKEKCCCCPLALCCLLASVFWMATGIVAISSSVKEGDVTFLILLPGILNCIVGGLGILSALCKFACGALVIFYMYLISWLTTLITFIVQWVDWGKALNADGDDKIDADWQMVSWTILQSVLIILGWCICSIYYSLYKLQSEGKSGWS
eukprot:Trichotokara_eunicae@DN9507_c0_g1_i1.p1